MSEDSQSELRRRKPPKQPDTDNSDNDEPDPDEKPSGPPKSPMEIAQEKYRKFFTRSIWGVLMIVVFAAILYLGHAFVSVFVVLLQIMVFKEILSLRYIEAKERKLWGFRSLHWFFLFGSTFYVYGTPIIGLSSKLIRQIGLNVDVVSRLHLLISFTLYIICFVGFIATLKRGSLKYQFGQLTWTLMTLLIVIGQSNFIIQNIWKGLFWFLLPCSLIICNDIMAYMCGLAAGRVFIKKPLTSLSPNKTWEGFVGALFCTLAWAFVFSHFLAQYEWFICPKEITYDLTLNVGHCVPDLVFLPRVYELPPVVVLLLSKLGYHIHTVELLPVQLHALILALFASLIAPFGGFFASGMKRAYGVKDFDSLFPGHGGVTDRMDCQFIMGFFAYVYHTVVISSGVNTVPQLLSAIAQLSVEDQILIFNSLKQSLKV